MREVEEEMNGISPFRKQDEAFHAAMQAAIERGLETAPVPVVPEGFSVPCRFSVPLNRSVCSSGAQLCAETA